MGVKGGEAMNVHAPKWRYDWNLNSLGLIFGFLATFASLVAGWQNLTNKLEQQAEKVAANQADIRRIENETRRFEALEFRVGAVESRATSAADSLRMVEQSINNLSSDMRLVREILERLERAQNGGSPYHGNPTPFRGTAP